MNKKWFVMGTDKIEMNYEFTQIPGFLVPASLSL
jgi:hypothetical protein